MSHTPITAEQLSAYVAGREIDVASHFGGGYMAQVNYNIGHGMYHVYDHRELIMSTTSADVAAETYNAIRPARPRPEIAVDTRPQCTAESPHPDSNHPSHGHLCGLEAGHSEREHRCPCDEDWVAAGSVGVPQSKEDRP